MHLKADWQVVRGIPEGRNEQEMWEIFQKVYGQMHEGDELYIDLTHAFRYLPMLVLVLSNYAKLIGKTFYIANGDNQCIFAIFSHFSIAIIIRASHSTTTYHCLANG